MLLSVWCVILIFTRNLLNVSAEWVEQTWLNAVCRLKPACLHNGGKM